MKRLTIVITLFLICLWCSILFLDRRPKHCHWDFALIVIVKITFLFLLFLAVWSTRRSPTCFGVIWCVFNSLCILNNSRDKFADIVNPLLSSPLISSYKPPSIQGNKINTPSPASPSYQVSPSSPLLFLISKLINDKLNRHFMRTDPV